jgi:hypothetical protein
VLPSLFVIPKPAILFVLASAACAQSSVLGKSCNLSILRQDDTKPFLAFDRELRTALSRQDAGMMALLVRYPLRINDGRGSWYIQDDASLHARFGDIFPPAIRSAVINQAPESLSCNYRGIMYGTGAVWVNPSVEPKEIGYVIEAINLPHLPDPNPRPSVRVDFACRTENHRILIDSDAAGVPRYRAWNKPHAITAKPYLENWEPPSRPTQRRQRRPDDRHQGQALNHPLVLLNASSWAGCSETAPEKSAHPCRVSRPSTSPRPRETLMPAPGRR